MTYAAHHENFVPYIGGEGLQEARIRRQQGRRSAAHLRRLFALASEAVPIERSPRFLARSGGRLTDDLERELMRRLSTSNWRMRD